jgi:hypothetical protein
MGLLWQLKTWRHPGDVFVRLADLKPGKVRRFLPDR